ncbi:MAG: hypothetical protein NTU66_06030 [Elusimicrobia bacterium]|nr:hypothetical protein [Elusimicrobiota bacterium]
MKMKMKLKQKAVQRKVASDEAPKPAKEGIVLHSEATRNEMMITAKERGVKNFRVLNKQELADVLRNIGDQKAVDAIVAGAVARWKSGWGSKKVANESENRA